ncbi:hypothetical protein [Streptomyces chryseus]
MTTPVDHLAAALTDAQTAARQMLANGTQAIETANKRRATEEQRAQQLAQALAAMEADRNRQRKYARKAAQRLAQMDSDRDAWETEQLAQARQVATAASHRATAAEQQLAAVRSELHDVKLRRDDARAGRADAERRAGIAEQVAEGNKKHVQQLIPDMKRAEAALDRVRNAPSLGAALAAVADYDGLNPARARIQAEFTEAADSTRARLDEQAREHAIELATMARRASAAETTLDRVRAARQWADVWTALGMHYGLTSQQAGQEARARRTTAERRADGWRQHALTADARADRHLAAWRSARRRAREHAVEEARIRGWCGHWNRKHREARHQLDRTLAAWRNARQRAADRTEERDRALALAATPAAATTPGEQLRNAVRAWADAMAPAVQEAAQALAKYQEAAEQARRAPAGRPAWQSTHGPAHTRRK